MIRELLVCVFLLIGVLLSLVSAVGVIRLPDLFTRMHAATKTGTVGVASITIGMMIHFGEVTVTSRGILVIMFSTKAVLHVKCLCLNCKQKLLKQRHKHRDASERRKEDLANTSYCTG